jgi:alanyl-tRNA synthetase
MVMTGNDIRQLYLDYFKKHGHRVIRSSSLIPQDDPTLLFTNAGMVQFKRTCSLGDEKRDYVQGGNGLKNACGPGANTTILKMWAIRRGIIPFFEMLGNFSFGDYFKEKAIEFGMGSSDQRLRV